MPVTPATSPVYTVHTLGTVTTRIAVALIDVDLAVGPRRAGLAATLVAVDQVLTEPSKLARVALALIDLCLTKVTGEPWVAVARERVLTVNTLSPVTRRALAVIDVCLTVGT
jgi:hypothetical protein